MPEDEIPKPHEFSFSKEERDPLKELIFSLPCTAAERQWLSYFYNKDESIKTHFANLYAGIGSPEDFVIFLRQQIDHTLLKYIEGPIDPGKSVRIAPPRANYIASNWDEYRDRLITLFLCVQRGDLQQADKNYKSLTMKLNGGLRVAKRDRRKNLKFYRKQSSGNKFINDERQLLKILYFYEINTLQLKQKMGSSPWIKRQLSSILSAPSGQIQYDMLCSFPRDFSYYLREPLRFDSPMVGKKE